MEALDEESSVGGVREMSGEEREIDWRQVPRDE
jgi:hypothetical protein